MTEKESLYTGEMRIAKDETDGEYLVVGVPFFKDRITSFSKIKGLHYRFIFDRVFFNRYGVGICALKEKPKAGDIFEVMIKNKGTRGGADYYQLKVDGTFELVDFDFVLKQFKKKVGKLIIPDETF